MSINYQNLVFKGGGVKGIAYAGALEVLEEQNILPGIQRVAGTSAGSIVAALIALKYNAADVKSIVGKTDFASFEDKKSIFRIATKYGLYKGDAFLKWMKTQISQADPTKNGLKHKLSANATFQDFAEAGCRDLHVFATDLNLKQVTKFSVEDYPNVIVAEAVRASMSIPLFFMAWQFSNGQPNDHLYVDGGTVYNYPLSAFDTGGEPNPATLGFHLDNLHGVEKSNDLEYNHLLKYVKDTFETLLSAQNINFENDPEAVKRTVKIDDLGISATDFGLKDSQKTALYNSGVKYTKEYLSKQ
ncbi:MAG: patatin-like phospholipase family protein [Bacteroidetes bacterium]|nr:patatin-like phospholipase family protein [Bacteroidota bacterium]